MFTSDNKHLCRSSAGLLWFLGSYVVFSAGPLWVVVGSSEGRSRVLCGSRRVSAGSLKVLCACEAGPKLATFWLFCVSLTRVLRVLWVVSKLIKIHMHRDQKHQIVQNALRFTSFKHIDCGFFRDLKDYFSEHFTLRELRMINIFWFMTSQSIGSWNLNEAFTEIFIHYV